MANVSLINAVLCSLKKKNFKGMGWDGIGWDLHVGEISVHEEGAVVDCEEDLAGRGEDFVGDVTVD